VGPDSVDATAKLDVPVDQEEEVIPDPKPTLPAVKRVYEENVYFLTGLCQGISYSDVIRGQSVSCRE